MKIAVSLPDPLFKRAEAEAKKRGVSRSKLHQMALEGLLSQQYEADITAALKHSYEVSPEDAGKFVQGLASATLHRTEWQDEARGDLVGKPRGTKRVRARVASARPHRLSK